MGKLAFLAVLMLTAPHAVAAEDAPRSASWDGDRGLYLAPDGRWHQGWGHADLLARPRRRDVDTTGTAACRTPLKPGDALRPPQCK